jgi:hypothetical protein
MTFYYFAKRVKTVHSGKPFDEPLIVHAGFKTFVSKLSKYVYLIIKKRYGYYFAISLD